MVKNTLSITLDDYIVKWIHNQKEKHSTFVNKILNYVFKIESGEGFNDLKQAEIYLDKLIFDKEEAVKEMDRKIEIMKTLIEKNKAEKEDVKPKQ